ncbi:MAG: hypothetical protein R3E42_09165 [Burkholderiaceae bacterium]
MLTGESHPVTKQRGEGVVAGSFNLAGAVEVVRPAPGSRHAFWADCCPSWKRPAPRSHGWRCWQTESQHHF